MSIDKKRLEINVNLYALRPDFLNLELYYVIASNENTFRFVEWSEEPTQGEQKFYCYLSDQDFYLPAGNITLKQSYVLKEDPAYPLICSDKDFEDVMKHIENGKVAKGIRRFKNEDVNTIQENLCNTFGDCEKHLVKSAEAQHLLFVVKNIEISISATMVYFRQKAEFSEPHYEHVKEE